MGYLGEETGKLGFGLMRMPWIESACPQGIAIVEELMRAAEAIG